MHLSAHTQRKTQVVRQYYPECVCVCLPNVDCFLSGTSLVMVPILHLLLFLPMPSFFSSSSPSFASLYPPLSLFPDLSPRSNWSSEGVVRASEALEWTAPHSPAWSSWLRSLSGRGLALWSTWRAAWSWWFSRPQLSRCSAASSSPFSSDTWIDPDHCGNCFDAILINKDCLLCSWECWRKVLFALSFICTFWSTGGPLKQ